MVNKNVFYEKKKNLLFVTEINTQFETQTKFRLKKKVELMADIRVTQVALMSSVWMSASVYNLQWTRVMNDNHSGHWMNNLLSDLRFTFVQKKKIGKKKRHEWEKKSMNAKKKKPLSTTVDGFWSDSLRAVTSKTIIFNIMCILKNEWNEIPPQTCLSFVHHRRCQLPNNETMPLSTLCWIQIGGWVEFESTNCVVASAFNQTTDYNIYLFYFWICHTRVCVIQSSCRTIYVINCIWRIDYDTHTHVIWIERRLHLSHLCERTNGRYVYV